MELKVLLAKFDVFELLRFNRTFMELKVRLLWSTRKRHMFQSHLYGIERGYMAGRQ